MTHKDQEFNKFCADVMGLTYKVVEPTNGMKPYIFTTKLDKYSPHDDLNQRMPVFDKLWLNADMTSLEFGNLMAIGGIDKATKYFITSTMPEKE